MMTGRKDERTKGQKDKRTKGRKEVGGRKVKVGSGRKDDEGRKDGWQKEVGGWRRKRKGGSWRKEKC